MSAYNKFAKKESQKFLEVSQGVMHVPTKEMAVVKYIGHTDFAEGIWIGLELRNPKGEIWAVTVTVTVTVTMHQGSTPAQCRAGGISAAGTVTGSW